MKNMQENEIEDDFISKTQRKAEANAKQMVGKKLIDLTDEQVVKLKLDESLHDAVMEAKRIKSNSALRRQLQYIGRLMRDVDTAPIEEQLARWEGKHSEEKAIFHALEKWRDRLIDEVGNRSTDALQAFIDAYPNAEVQQLRTLSRNAHKEKITNKPPRSSRELFKLIRQIAENAQD